MILLYCPYVDGSLYGQKGFRHQCTTRGCGVSGGCPAPMPPPMLAPMPVPEPAEPAEPEETQQQSGPSFAGAGQQLVQNVIQVQSGAASVLLS